MVERTFPASTGCSLRFLTSHGPEQALGRCEAQHKRCEVRRERESEGGREGGSREHCTMIRGGKSGRSPNLEDLPCSF
jgi:hypothetical protein